MKFDDRALERLRMLLSARPAIELPKGPYRRAAVVAPLLRKNGGWSLLFLRRSESLPTHGGQVAFPGGAAETDEAFDQAALREVEEEIGIPRDRIELIGRLDDMITISGFVVAPYIGVVDAGQEYILQESEVVEVYEVPVEALLEPGNPQVRYVSFRNRDYPAYFYHHGTLEIWGLTGRMVKALLDVAVLAM